MLAPSILPKIAARLCFEGRRDNPLQSNSVVGVEKTKLVVDDKELMITSVVDDCGPEAPCVVSSCRAF
jgi:hypothetical protein